MQTTMNDELDVFRRLRDVDPDAFRVVRVLAERVTGGVKQYGKLDLGKDARDANEETFSEVADALFYAGITLARAKRAEEHRSDNPSVVATEPAPSSTSNTPIRK